MFSRFISPRLAEIEPGSNRLHGKKATPPGRVPRVGGLPLSSM